MSNNNGNIDHARLSGMTKEQLINMLLNTTASTKVGPVVKTVSAKARPVFRSLQAIITRTTSG